MHFLLDSDWSSVASQATLGRHVALRNILRNLNQNGHTYSYVPNREQRPDVILLDNVFCVGRVVRYLYSHHLYDWVKDIRVLVHSMDAVPFWDAVSFFRNTVYVLPDVTSERLFHAHAPAGTQTIVSPWPVYAKESSGIVDSGKKTVFYGRLDDATKFPIADLLSKLPKSVFEQNDIHVAGAQGNRAYWRQLLQLSKDKGFTLHTNAPDINVSRLLESAERVFCLSCSPQESYGIAPREVLYTSAELITTQFSGFDLKGLGCKAFFTLGLELRDDITEYFNGVSWHEDTSRYRSVYQFESLSKKVLDILGTAPRVSDRTLRDMYLKNINSQFVPNLFNRPNQVLQANTTLDPIDLVRFGKILSGVEKMY